MNKLKKLVIPVAFGIIGVTVFNSCSVGVPKGATAVKNFDVNQYLGKWYEIARFDYRFEKNLNNVTATYSKKENGNIKVENKGYNYVKEKWSESDGEAKFLESENVAMLKVSFFKPFWAGYNVIDIDDDYKYALISGSNLDYLWILSREKTIPIEFKQRFLKKAEMIGYDIEKLIWVEHTK